MTQTPDADREAIAAPPLPQLAPPWSIRLARPESEDLARIHGWMAAGHVAAHWDQAWSTRRWHTELASQLAGSHSRPCVVDLDDEPLAYLEVYRVVRDPLSAHYQVRPHDLGVHIAIGEPHRCGRGLGTALLRATAEGLLSAEPACTRIVAEPDDRNDASLAAFARAGFSTVGRLGLPHKTAVLLVRPRADHDLPPADRDLPPVGREEL
jgi:RimJ/RimL family protein N-acetyltransferase